MFKHNHSFLRLAGRGLVGCGLLGLVLAACSACSASSAGSATAQSTLSSGGSAPAATAQAAATAAIKPQSPDGIAGWHETGSYTKNALNAGEGVATINPPGKTEYQLYRGLASVPVRERAEGWEHVGDPDSADGYIVDPYQGRSSGNSKMYLLTTPTGKTYKYVHTLVPGELYNNSWDALAPAGQWMISGEWGTMSHFQIYPAPYLNHATGATGGPLKLSGYINLNTRVSNIQGCDFVTATELICASSDHGTSLFTNAFPLLKVALAAPLNGATVAGTVTDLGSIPQHSSCSGTFEPEGVDYDPATGVLRVEITQPGLCKLKTTVYTYKQN